MYSLTSDDLGHGDLAFSDPSRSGPKCIYPLVNQYGNQKIPYFQQVIHFKGIDPAKWCMFHCAMLSFQPFFYIFTWNSKANQFWMDVWWNWNNHFPSKGLKSSNIIETTFYFNGCFGYRADKQLPLSEVPDPFRIDVSGVFSSATGQNRLETWAMKKGPLVV